MRRRIALATRCSYVWSAIGLCILDTELRSHVTCSCEGWITYNSRVLARIHPMLAPNLILDRSDSDADRTALTRGSTSLTYGELGNLVRSTAAGFSELGIGPGERVAVYLNKRIEGVVSYFAATLAGAVFVPINPVLKPAQVHHILNDCSVSLLVTSSAQARALSGELANCPHLRHIVTIEDDWQRLTAASPAHETLARRIDNDVAAILYTSGSTGRPKGVVLSHRNIVAGAASVASYLENSANDVILSALPLSFDAGFSQLTTGFFAGAEVVLLDYLLPQDVPKAIARHGITGLTGVPPLWNQLKKVNWPDEARTSLRYIANTGGAMPTATLEALRSLLPKTRVFLMYGLTEAFRSTFLPPDELDRRPTSIGKAIPNAEILVVRDDGSPCDPGEPGELVHRGALVSLGYWNDPERTAGRFRPVPGQSSELPFDEVAVWSGDTVVRDDGGFLYFVGRKDDMIKSSGYRISPTEVEEVVYKTSLVNECAALGVPHPELGQAVVVVATGKDTNDEAAESIIESCKQALPNFMIPARIIWQDTMPKNPNGKIDRKKLAASLDSLFKEPC